MPARNVTDVKKTIATTMTSATVASHAGSVLINANNDSNIFIFLYAPTGTTVTIALGTAGLLYGVVIAPNDSNDMLALLAAYLI